MIGSSLVKINPQNCILYGGKTLNGGILQASDCTYRLELQSKSWFRVDSKFFKVSDNFLASGEKPPGLFFHAAVSP